jgi:murein DD-endopeptidase MepM/ murein hydrolase activator NlpD
MPRTRRILLSSALTVFAALASTPFWLQRRRPAPVEAPPPPPNESLRTGRIGRNGSLYVSLASLGVPRAELSLIESAFRKVFNPRLARPTDEFEVRASTDGVVRNIKYWPDSRRYVWIQRDGAGFAADLHEVPLGAVTVGATGRIETSLWDAMADAGIPAEVIMNFTDVFAWDVDFLTEPRPGDTFKLVWTRLENGKTTLNGDVMIAEYHGSLAGDRFAVKFGDGYYDMNGESLRRQFLHAPLNYRRISSRFTAKRYHPILKRVRPHHGIDYAAAYGTPVVAIGQGIVTQVGRNGGIGNMIEVRHNSTYASIYGHLSKYASGIRPGKHVNQGQVIGFVGSTGLSTGPHLHFGFKRNGALVNFFGLKIPTNKKLDKNELVQFSGEKRDALMLLAQVRTPGAPLVVNRPVPAGGPGGASK